jgi:hypothetical protein
MKAIACILLLGYWMFGAAPNEYDGQNTSVEIENERVTEQNQSSLRLETSTNEVVFLDANGNIVKSDSGKFATQEEGF